MTKEPRRPTMNGAASRLQQLYEQATKTHNDLEQAELDLAFTQRGINQVITARAEIVQLIEELRNAQTLAGPQNWRLLAGHDKTFIYELLRNADAATLRAAIKELSPEIRQRLREDLEDAERDE